MSINMKVFWLSAVVSLMASLAAAEKVVVRSGEHDGFSRFVVHLPQRIGWTLSGTKRAKNLVLEASEIEWNLNQIFMRISDRRIKNIEPLKERVGLAIDLNCTCKVDVFWHGYSMLVVDVSDVEFSGPEVLAPKYISIQEVESNKPQASSLMQSGRPPSLDASQETAIRLAGESLLPTLKNSTGGGQVSQRSSRAARRDIAKQFGRAADLGLVDLALSMTDATSGLVTQDVESPKVPNADKVQPERSMVLGNVISYTSADPFLSSGGRNVVNNQKGKSCIPDDQISIESWGGGGPFIYQIGAAHREIAELMDQGSVTSKLNIVRLYLYFGFGAEAEQIITAEDLSDESDGVYLAISQILDGGVTGAKTFEDQAGCNGDVALWSVLNYGDGISLQGVNIEAILRAITSLPDHLRILIAPRLVKKFQENDKNNASEQVFRILNRSSGDGKFDWMSRNVNEGILEESEKVLLSAVDGNTEVSPLALMGLIDNRVGEYSDIPPGWIDLVGSYAHEQREAEIGEALGHRYMRALAAAGRYELAFDEINSSRADGGSKALIRSADMIASYTVRNSDDVTFLKHLGYRGKKGDLKLSGAVENEVANRLLGLGLPSEALTYLTGNAEGAAQEKRRLLRAEASLAMGAPREAIGSLLGMSGDAVDTLRAQANDQLGYHMVASQLYGASGDDKGALRQALQADDWQEAARLADPELTNIIEINDKSTIEGDVNAPLVRGDRLLAESEFIRGRIMEFLEASDILIESLN